MVRLRIADVPVVTTVGLAGRARAASVAGGRGGRLGAAARRPRFRGRHRVLAREGRILRSRRRVLRRRRSARVGRLRVWIGRRGVLFAAGRAIVVAGHRGRVRASALRRTPGFGRGDARLVRRARVVGRSVVPHRSAHSFGARRAGKEERDGDGEVARVSRRELLVHARQGGPLARSGNDTAATFHVTDSPAAPFQPEPLRLFRHGYRRTKATVAAESRTPRTRA